jgi:hypothetical protein
MVQQLWILTRSVELLTKRDNPIEVDKIETELVFKAKSHAYSGTGMYSPQ